ncbi:DUF1156 domain-containing protein [Dokdonella sp.]|uniref:DUF1156 domain-containing protein n=1 Tax=Dokdonella sp. TaxID=2291710 RepID=UPI0039C88938
MNHPIHSPKIHRSALPLDDIDIAAAREKSIRHGHASTLHLYWARRASLLITASRAPRTTAP